VFEYLTREYTQINVSRASGETDAAVAQLLSWGAVIEDIDTSTHPDANVITYRFDD
jgi:hypothetical protein